MILTGSYFRHLNPILDRQNVTTTQTFRETAVISANSDQSNILNE